MDAIEILGSLLGAGNSGGKSGGGGGGLGGAILDQILGGAKSQQPAPRQAPPRSGGTQANRPVDLQREAQELEDLLNVAKGRQGQAQPQQPFPQPRSTPQSNPFPQTFPQTSGSNAGGYSRNAPQPRITPPDYRNDTQRQNEDAVVLIRAMINAAKSDGQLTDEEQKAILERVGNPTQEVVQFLRDEFSKPLDVREFAWSVPIGLEQKVYTMSMAAIKLDANKEADYLRDLAHGLRLTPDVCNQIHQQFGAPEIF